MTSHFTIKWKPELSYELYFNDKLIGEGKLPPEILQPMVDYMNFAYNEGSKQKKSIKQFIKDYIK